jgi:ADP-ribose pyrophosphatase YjhB (NUDIX family)
MFIKIICLNWTKAIVINTDKKILLLQRSEKSGSGGKWSFPGVH